MSRKRETRPEQVPMKPGQPAQPPVEASESTLQAPESQSVETLPTESTQEQQPEVQPSETVPEQPQPEGEPEVPQPVELPPEPLPVSLSDIMATLNELKVLIHDQHEMLLTFQTAKRPTAYPLPGLTTWKATSTLTGWKSPAPRRCQSSPRYASLFPGGIATWC